MIKAPMRLWRIVSLASVGLWLVCTLLAIFQPANPLIKYQWYILTVALTAFAFGHGVRRYGWLTTFSLFVIASIISTTSETLRIHFGFPFGYYVHTPQMGPQILSVPIIIGPIYFGICYMVWTLTEMILGQSAQSRRPIFLFVAPIIAAQIVTGFDMCFDPIGATIGKYWLYRDGGAYFGVPIHNYVGWLLNAWAIFQCFALYLCYRRSSDSLTLDYWFEVSAFWGLMGLQYPVLLLAVPGSVVVKDSGGWAWRSGDILANAAICSVYTMILAALLSIVAVKLRGVAINRPTGAGDPYAR